MDQNTLLTLPADEVSLLFSWLLITMEDFTSFSSLFMVWKSHQTPATIKDVLEKLDWQNVFELDHRHIDLIRDRFPGFIDYCVCHNVTQALWLKSSTELFRFRNVQHHLDVLEMISDSYFPARVAFIIFKAIYRPFDLSDTAKQWKHIIGEKWLLNVNERVVYMLTEMFQNMEDRENILPVFRFCPNARNPEPLYVRYGHVYNYHIWDSLCDQTIAAPEVPLGTNWPEFIHTGCIWTSECPFCSLQIIVFKFLNYIRYN